MLQLLWFETILKAAFGLPLLLLPLTVIRILGLPRPDSGFWPRFVGAVCCGISIGVFVSIRFPQAHGGIGPAGLIPINLAAAAALIASLIMGSAAPTRRGRIAVLVCAVTLLSLGFLEIAHF